MRSEPPPRSPVAVLHLVDTLFIGGTERQLLEQLRMLDRRRWRPLAASLHREGELVNELAALDVPHTAFPLRRSLGHPNTLLQVVRLAAHLVRHDVRLVHAHDFYSNVVGVAAARLARRRSLASRRDLAHWLSPVQRAALGWSCRAADRVITNAAALATLAVRDLGVDERRVVVLRNGLDLARFDEAAARAPSPPLEPAATPTVAMVSSMHLRDKGQGDLLEASSLLHGRGLRHRLLLVGDGIQRATLEQQARSLGVSDHVRFLGRRSDVPSLLARVDVACHASWAEGFPNAVMEAMAASRPVVATRVGGCPELIAPGVNGLLVAARDPPALAAAIEQLLADPSAAQRMGQRARATVQEAHSLVASAARLDELYEALLRRGGATP